MQIKYAAGVLLSYYCQCCSTADVDNKDDDNGNGDDDDDDDSLMPSIRSRILIGAVHRQLQSITNQLLQTQKKKKKIVIFY